VSSRTARAIQRNCLEKPKEKKKKKRRDFQGFAWLSPIKVVSVFG
jgi:hypothetical protein